jgi:DNA polymerase III subunit delta
MLIFLYGADAFRARNKLKGIKENFRQKTDPTGANIIHLAGEGATLQSVSEAASSIGLFARRRMVVLDEVFENKNPAFYPALRAFLKNHGGAAEGNVIVLLSSASKTDKLSKDKKALFDALAKEKFAQEFKPLAGRELSDWMEAEFKKRDAVINKDALQLLLDLQGADLWRQNNEIEKLTHFKAAQRRANGAMMLITREDVLSAGILENELEIFSLVDAVSAKDKARALNGLEDFFRSGNKNQSLLPLLIRQFKILLLAKEMVDSGISSYKISSELKLPSFVVQKAVVQSRKYTPELLKKIFNSLVHMDYELKSGANSLPASLDILVSRI